MKPSAIFLSIVFLLAAVSCGKEKDNSHVPAGRVAHMTVTQHTPGVCQMPPARRTHGTYGVPLFWHTPDRDRRIYLRRDNARTLDLHLFG